MIFFLMMVTVTLIDDIKSLIKKFENRFAIFSDY